MKKEIVLLADVGGTNVRFGTYTENEKTANFDKKYLVANFKSFEEAVETYLKETGKKPTLCVIGAAGNIDEANGEVLTSNTPWRVSISKLKSKFPQLKKVSLDNDFALQGWAIEGLESHQYRTLFGHPQVTDLTNSKVAVLGLGTGCGTCLMMKTNEAGQIIYTSESGHSSLPHVDFGNSDNELRDKVIKTLKNRYEKNGKGIVVEHIISGTGIRNVYLALKQGEIPKDSSNLVTAFNIEKLAESGDTTALKTFDIVFAYLGAHTGSIAATIKADNIFYCGGLLASSWVQGRLEQSEYFKKQLEHRAGMTDAMKNLRFSVSLYREMAEKGAIVRAQRLINENAQEEEKKRSNTNLLQALAIAQALIESECPQVLPQMKRVIQAVEKYKIATQKVPFKNMQNKNQSLQR